LRYWSLKALNSVSVTLYKLQMSMYVTCNVYNIFSINAQEHRDYEEMIRFTDISSQDKRQQENTEEKRFLNQRDFIECKSAWS